MTSIYDMTADQLEEHIQSLPEHEKRFASLIRQAWESQFPENCIDLSHLTVDEIVEKLIR